MNAVFSASLMMALVGFVTWLLLRRVSVQSWRLRSFLAVAVLMQGLMFVRSPIHLGLIDMEPSPILRVTESFEIDFPAIENGHPSQSAGSVAPSRQVVNSSSSSSQDAWFALSKINVLGVFAWIWLTVCVAMFAVLGWRYLRILQLVKCLERAPDCHRNAWRSLVKQSGKAGDASRCEMLISQSVGPLLVRRPRGYALIVPRDYWIELTEDQQRGVMLHELAHLERGDVWRQLLTRLVVTIHWFNPVAWWALRQYEMAAECACDARVSREGRRAAAGFASALIEFMQWHDARTFGVRGLGVQAMAAPPLTVRISRLLQPNSCLGDSTMKRISLALFAIVLITFSFFQFHLTTAQETEVDETIRVIDKEMDNELQQIASKLDQGDQTTQRFGQLFGTPSGRIAIAGMLNSIRNQAQNQAKDEAIPRFMEHHFTKDANGKYVVREDSQEALTRWVGQAQRLSKDVGDMQTAMNEIAEKIDTSSEAAGLFQRLLRDQQAPVAIMIQEMEGGDVVTRFISEALGRILVERGNGTFIIVESRRDEATGLVDSFEMAGKIAKRLQRELPALASDYATDDEQHQKFVRYLKNPITALVAALQLSEGARSVSGAVEKLHAHFESASIDTAKGLQIQSDDAWESLEDIFRRVDRAESVVARVKERLAEVSETLAMDDELTKRFATQLTGEVAAVRIAAELPYADADAGEEFRALISEVFVESDGKFTIRDEQIEPVSAKARELLQVCRKIRRYGSEVEATLEEVADQTFVQELGEAGPYTILNEIRQFAERHQPNPIVLMQEHLLVASANDKLKIKVDQREVVRKLVAQAEKIQSEESNDDF